MRCSYGMDAQSRSRTDDLRITNYAVSHYAQSIARHNDVKVRDLRSD
jgi:hypothetical protein